MVIFIYFNLLLGFLRKFISKDYSHLYTNPPSAGGFVTFTLNSGITVYLGDIVYFLSDQLEHRQVMHDLANSYYDYVRCKVDSLNTIHLKNSSYDFSNLKPLVFKLNNVYTFIHTHHIINILSPFINIFNFCLQYTHILVPAIVFTLKPLLHTFLDTLENIIQKLLNLSKICWYYLLENIIEFINHKKHQKIFIALNSLIKEFDIRIINNEKMGYIFQDNYNISQEFPLFNDAKSEAELNRWFSELACEQDACKDILNTIRELEDIILTYFNSKHIVYPKHYLDSDFTGNDDSE